MKLWKNPGFCRESAVFLLICLVFALAALISGSAAALIAVLTLSAALFVWHLLTSRRRYRLMWELSAELDGILEGRESYDLDRFSEGELSILKSQLSKLLVTLRAQSEALSADKRFLSDALADISHQLKTPLTAINLAVAMLSAPGLSKDRRAELIREITGSLEHLEWLVSTLLKMSRFDAGMARLAPREVTLRELVASAAAPLRELFDLRGVELRLELTDDTLTADPVWLSEALGNILKNCLEHTPSGGAVTVSSSANPIYTGLTVSDTGPGISPEDLPHIFDRFYRGKNADARSAGIGLALARAVIQSSGGAVKAENTPTGARFTLRFYKSSV